jgi:hypothetical protein
MILQCLLINLLHPKVVTASGWYCTEYSESLRHICDAVPARMEYLRESEQVGRKKNRLWIGEVAAPLSIVDALLHG